MQGDLFGQVLPWLAGLLGVALAGGVLMLWTRRMAVGRDARRRREGFELDDLRSLMERGELSAEEYDRARRRMVDRARAGASPRGEAGAPRDKPSGKDR